MSLLLGVVVCLYAYFDSSCAWFRVRFFVYLFVRLFPFCLLFCLFVCSVLVLVFCLVCVCYFVCLSCFVCLLFACLLACFTSLFVNVLFAANALLHRLHVLQLSILYLCKRHHIYIYVFTYLSLFFRLAAYSVYFSAFNFF